MERKNTEDTVTVLRQELQILYESLKTKNEGLICLEKDLRNRDINISYLKEEYKRLKDILTCKTCPNCMKFVKEIPDENAIPVLLQDCTLNKLQKELKDRETLIKELNRKIIRLSDNLIFVQKESLSKDDRIEEMNRQLDKFREVVMSFFIRKINLIHNKVNVNFLDKTFYKSYYGTTQK